MFVSSFTSRSTVRTIDSRGSTYPVGIVQSPFERPYVLRTTRSVSSRTRNAPTPTVMGNVATFTAMESSSPLGEMALSIAPFPSRGGPMRRKVRFTPRRFLRKIWQLGNFDVSRDGRRLAYAANKGKQWSVYVMDLRTKRTKILLRSEQSVVQPEFSPDGKWLAVQSDFDEDENYNIYVTPRT